MTGTPPHKPKRSIKARVWAWMFAVLVALDILLAAIIGAAPGETVSHMAGRKGWEVVCAVLDVFERDHCAIVEF